MKLLLFFVGRIKLLHKLTYSKTMKSDIVVAFFSLIISLFIAYLSLNSIVGSSIDLYDIFLFLWYILIILLIIINII